MCFQPSATKDRAKLPKVLSRSLVFYGFPDVEYDNSNWMLIDRRSKSEGESRESTEPELAPGPITDRPTRYVINVSFWD
jgi:hypothetical protein